MQRPTLADLEATRFDVIVIGGGINGAAIARDAAMRGMSVCLLEKEDLASGTTAWSSRLIHGGLRYLEHREFGLVRESLRERERLLANAPHLVQPLPMVVPIHEGSKRGPWLVRAGMILYDILSFDKSLPLHRMLNCKDVLERVPTLEPAGLEAAAVYFDAQATFAERLVIENAISAADHGAAIATYTSVTGIRTDGAVVHGVTVRDELTGDAGEVFGRIVLNVAGPWVDAVLAGAPDGRTPARAIGGTKGSHLIVDCWPGAPDDALYFESRKDGRPVLVIPWNGMIMLGSTDLRYSGDLDRVETDDDEIDYLLDETNRIVAGHELTRDDVNYTYAGIRPLPYKLGGATGAITRRHLIRDHAPELRGLWSVIGGKLTTHRSLAEEAVDKAVEALGRDASCTTTRTPLPGAAGVAMDRYRQSFATTAGASGLSIRSAQRLVALYGTRAEGVLALVRGKPELANEIDPESGAIAAEVVFASQAEMAQSLTDILLRRTMIAYGPSVGYGADAAAAAVAGKHLGWNGARQSRELAAYRSWIERYRPRATPPAAAEPPPSA